MASEKYCYLVLNATERDLQTEIDIYKLFQDPMLYTHTTYPYRLIIDGPISTELNYITSADYNVFWELIYRLATQQSFYLNREYEAYSAYNVTIGTGVINFQRDNVSWHVYIDRAKLITEYPKVRKWYVFYDEDEKIDALEMHPLMLEMCSQLGKNNEYDGVEKYIYKDDLKTQNFYVFYQNPTPTELEVRNAIREHLTNKYGYNNAKTRFPNLFIDAFRRVYPLWENEGYPIQYEPLRYFVAKYGIYRPQVILILDWYCPVVIEYGLTDIIPNYTPVTEDDIESNNFIYFLSKILNYLQGQVLDQSFKQESNFYENEEYVSFVYKSVQWQVIKGAHNDYTGDLEMN